MVTDKYNCFFPEWEALPVSERRHRLVLFMAQKQLEQEAIRDAQASSNDREIERAARQETGR